MGGSSGHGKDREKGEIVIQASGLLVKETFVSSVKLNTTEHSYTTYHRDFLHGKNV